MDLSHKKIHVNNLKRQVAQNKEKIETLEQEKSTLNSELITVQSTCTSLQQRLADQKQKQNNTEEQTQKALLELQKNAEIGIKNLKVENHQSKKHTQEFINALCSIADQLYVKFQKLRQNKSSKFEAIAEQKRAQVRKEQLEISQGTISAKAQEIAMSILELSQDDFNEILQPNIEDTEEIKALILEAARIRKCSEDDMIWRDGFIELCHEKTPTSNKAYWKLI